MKCIRHSVPVDLLLIGAGLIGKHLGPLLASSPTTKRVRIIDRDVYSRDQVVNSADAGRPKAVVLAEVMQAINPLVWVEPVIADIEGLPLGLFRCRILLTALDSKRARMAANYAYLKLAIPCWMDSGVSAPWLVRISTFGQGRKVPCYECSLDSADYASEQCYPCQPQFMPPPSNSPEYLGSLAASFQAAECARLVSGQFEPTALNRELVYDASSQRMVVTHLEQSKACRADHGAFSIRPLRQSPRRITLAEVFALGAETSKSKAQAGAILEVPGRMFVRELVCACGKRRSVLRLKGRFGSTAQTCTMCGGGMFPTATGLTNILPRASLSPRDRTRTLAALGLQSADVIAIGDGSKVTYFELGPSRKGIV